MTEITDDFNAANDLQGQRLLCRDFEGWAEKERKSRRTDRLGAWQEEFRPPCGRAALDCVHSPGQKAMFPGLESSIQVSTR